MASGSKVFSSYNKGVKSGYITPSRASSRNPKFKIQTQAEAGTPF